MIFLGGRFATLAAQTRFARRHTPAGLAWCPYALHYVAAHEMKQRGWYANCAACYVHSNTDAKKHRRQSFRAHEQAERQKFQEFIHQRAVLKAEIAVLRQLKRALTDEIMQVRVGAALSDQAIERDGVQQRTESQLIPRPRRKGYTYAR